jgi:integrase
VAKTKPSLGLKYTTWDRTAGVWLYQREVPENAQILLHRKKITNSLGKTAAEAKARYMEVHAKWEKAIRDAIAAWTRDEDTDDFMDRMALFLNSQVSQHGGDLPESGLIKDKFAWDLRENLWSKWEKWNEVHDGTKVRDFLDDDAYEDCNVLIVGWEVFRAALRRRVEISAQLPAPLPEAGIATQDGQMVMSLSDLEARWLAEKKRAIASTNDMSRMINLFVGVNGNLPIHEITARHRLAFRDAVGAILGTKAQSKNKLMRQLSALGSYAEKLGVVTANPLRNRPFEVTDVVEVEPFTDDQLNKVFTGKGWKNLSPKYRSFIPWAFVIGAYTGARLGEIAQLRREDVFEHEGHWVFRFTFDDEVGLQSKTRQTRLVPVSVHLVEYGFLKFVEKIEGGQLWPVITPDTKGMWSGKVSSKVNAPIRAAGYPTKYRHHSLRHGVKTRLRGKVSDSVNDWITHPEGRRQSVAATYGKVLIEDMKKAVDLLDYKVEWPAA